MFTMLLARDVSPAIRRKGARYFESGFVIDISGSEWVVHATVRGTRDYRVEIVREGSRFRASCECPFYADRADICKHIWAALLDAEHRGLLTGDGTVESDALLEPAYVGPPPGVGVPPLGSGRSNAAPPRWKQFMDEVRSDVAAFERGVPQPRFVNGELVYGIDVRETLAGHGTAVHVLFRQRKRNGEWAKPKTAALTPREAEHLADPDDREILSLLLGASNPWNYPLDSAYQYGRPSRFYLSGPLEPRVLPMLVRTGRAYLMPSGADRELLPLFVDEGEPWRFEITLTDTAQDSVLVDGAFVRRDERLGLGDPLLLLGSGFLFTRSTIALLDVQGGFTWIARLRTAGALLLPREELPALAETLARAGMDPRSLPEAVRYDVVDGHPLPRVRVRRPDRRPLYGRQDLHAAVQFDYDGSLVDAAQPGDTYDAANRRLVRRNRSAEVAFLDRLHQLGFRYTWSHFESRQMLGIASEQFSTVVTTLVREGWHVEAEGRPFRSARGVQVHVSSGIDWFDLDGTVDFGDGHSAPFPRLLAALRRGEDVVVLDDGSMGLLPEEWLRRYASIASFGQAEGERLRFRRSQAVLLDALLAAQPEVSTFDETFARMRSELLTFNGVKPEDPPASFRGTLREYQRDALGWFAFLRRFGFGGCLADDMGLGKTVMVLALLEGRRLSREDPAVPSLAVVPRSLVFNWIDEASRFAPKLRVVDYTGTSRDLSRIAGAELVLTTYGTMLRDAPLLKDIEFDYVILDEAQAIKNAATASSKAARLLRGRHRLALSGTPIENHLGELWSLFEFLNPGMLGSAKAFQKAGARTRDEGELAMLSRALRPFILRRTKEQVAPELPNRTEQTLHCELEGAQRRHYDELRAHYRETLLERVAKQGINKSKIQILEALLRLRQAASHSGLIDPSRAGEASAKFDVLLPRLTEVIDEGHKALVFSQFTSLLALLRPKLDAMGITYEYLDGRTRDRAARVDRFQSDPACPLFLISLKAGGLGLNLTAAEYVFLLDPWWNPAVEAQAIDRAHRIGQSRHVFAYRLLARDTVEEKVAELQASKQSLADAILNADAGLIRSLKPEDLEILLA